jgi:hypothetical protein
MMKDAADATWLIGKTSQIIQAVSAASSEVRIQELQTQVWTNSNARMAHICKLEQLTANRCIEQLIKHLNRKI